MSLRPGSSSSSESVRRKNSYKSGVDAKLSRRRREKELVTVRKNKRQYTLFKKRIQTHNSTSDADNIDHTDKFLALVKLLHSNDAFLQAQGTGFFRYLLEHGYPPSLHDAILERGIIPIILTFLERFDSPPLQLQAVLLLVNVAYEISIHAVPGLVNILKRSNDDDVLEQSTLLLGNIASHSIINRDIVLHHGALAPLLSRLNEHSRLPMLKSGSWTLSNLVWGVPPPDLEMVKHVIPVLWFLIQSTDEEVLTHACLALSYLSGDDESVPKIEAIVQAGFCTKLVSLLAYQSDKVIELVLQNLGNIIANGGGGLAQLLIDAGLLEHVLIILMYKRVKDIIEEACWVVSNITAGSRTHIQAVIDANIFPALISILDDAAQFDIKKEVLCTIVDVTCIASHEQIRFLVANGCIKPLCDLMICSDPIFVSTCLQGLENILLVGEADKEMALSGGNVYACWVDECGGKDKIEKLLTHDNKDIYGSAVRILERFWPDGDDDYMQEDGLNFSRYKSPTWYMMCTDGSTEGQGHFNQVCHE